MIPIRKNRPKVEPKQKPDEIDPEVLRAAADFARDFGYNPACFTLSAQGFWLDEPDVVPWENPYWSWFTAMEALDRHGDKEPFWKMLREFCAEKDPTVALLIDDLFARYNFERVPSRPRVPIYDLSDRHKALLCALKAVRDKKHKMPKEQAIKEVARDFKISQTTLEYAVEGRHDGLRRKMKELERLKSDWLARELKRRPASRR